MVVEINLLDWVSTYGVGIAIAVYLVWWVTTKLNGKLDRLAQSTDKLSDKIDELRNEIIKLIEKLGK